MNEFLKKYNNNASSNIGKLNEGKLFIVLNNLYPNHEIVDCSNKSKHGDIILRRQTYKDVIFENKHYTSNVPKEDVFKFIRDYEEQNSCGISNKNTEFKKFMNEHKEQIIFIIYNITLTE